MFTPTIEQLEKLGFKKEEIQVVGEWFCAVYEIGCYDKIEYKPENNGFRLLNDDVTEFYPESIEDLQTIIKCFRIK